MVNYKMNFIISRIMKKLSLITVSFLLSVIALAQDLSIFESRTFSVGKDNLPYRVSFPENYNPSQKYPLVVFLHGAGERGIDNQKQLTHRVSLFASSESRQKFPAIVVFPQCPISDFWARTRLLRAATDSTPFILEYMTDVPMNKHLGLVSKLLDSLSATRSVDAQRIYIGGLSMGGMGTFEMLWRKPNFFAAAFPICGGGNPSTAAVYGKGFPIWIFHGDKDPVVGVNDSRQMVDALKAAGANVKYTEYPGVKHDSWNNAFAEKDLLPWLFGQRKN